VWSSSWKTAGNALKDNPAPSIEALPESKLQASKRRRAQVWSQLNSLVDKSEEAVKEIMESAMAEAPTDESGGGSGGGGGPIRNHLPKGIAVTTRTGTIKKITTGLQDFLMTST